jgi:hypothetical protein
MLEKDDFRKDLQARVEKLANLLKLRNKLDIQIAQSRRDIGNISGLLGEHPADALKDTLASQGRMEGLNDACRDALLTFSEPATTSEIMEAMLTMGFSPKSRSNLLASVQTTLRRMPEVVESEKSGKKAYMLNPAFKKAVDNMVEDELHDEQIRQRRKNKLKP